MGEACPARNFEALFTRTAEFVPPLWEAEESLKDAQ